MLHAFLTRHRAEIIARCRAKVAARSAPPPTHAEVEHGVPLFLDQLVEILRLRSLSSSEIRDGAARHGDEMLRLGCSVGQVVYDYGDVCQSVIELALERGAPITKAEFCSLNRCLDDAIANAVTEYSRQRDRRASDEETGRYAAFSHELRNLLGTAVLWFDSLRTGSEGVGQPPSAMLGRSLSRLCDFVDRSLTTVRFEMELQNRQRIAVAEFMVEIELSAAMKARVRGLDLTVERADGDVVVDADRQILTSIVANLLENALKFTRPGGCVSLRSFAAADRVLIEVEDECGGLPPGDPKALFLPFEQRSNDRTGLGLGLMISHRGVEASGGVLRVRDLPGTGCVFTVDLPRAAGAAGVECA